MMLSTQVGISFFESLNSQFIVIFQCVDRLEFGKANGISEKITLTIESKKKEILSENELNDFYLLRSFSLMIHAYIQFWDLVKQHKFESSWVALQDACDFLRVVKNFSLHPSVFMGLFEDQLVEIENLYPYSVFFSTGMVFDKSKCSICGYDPKSNSCLHLKGELYSGELAVEIIENILTFDHVAMVEHPKDKRCVITYGDDAPQFRMIRYVSDLIADDVLTPFSFKQIKERTKIVSKTELSLPQRNEKCVCQSGKKFKKCCIDKDKIELPHNDIILDKELREKFLSLTCLDDGI